SFIPRWLIRSAAGVFALLVLALTAFAVPLAAGPVRLLGAPLGRFCWWPAGCGLRRGWPTGTQATTSASSRDASTHAASSVAPRAQGDSQQQAARGAASRPPEHCGSPTESCPTVRCGP